MGCGASEVSVEKTEIPLTLIKQIQHECRERQDPYFDLKQCMKTSNKNQWSVEVQCEQKVHKIIAQQHDDGTFEVLSFE